MSERATAPYTYTQQFDDLPEPVLMVRTPDGRGLGVNRLFTSPKNPTIFLLHGSPGCRLGPMPRASVLHMLGVNMISYDRPGYGRSDRQEGRSVADAAKDVEAIADALNIERFGVLGRSGGGAIALGCAALMPDRVANAAALVGMAPPSSQFDRYAGMVTENLELYKVALRDSTELQARYAALASKVAARPGTFLDDFLLDQMPDMDKDIANHGFIRPLQLAAYREALVPQQGIGWADDTLAINRDWGFELASIQQPTLIWHGERDAFSPPHGSDYIAEQIRQGGNQEVHLELVANDGHFGALKAIPGVLAWQRNHFEEPWA